MSSLKRRLPPTTSATWLRNATPDVGTMIEIAGRVFTVRQRFPDVGYCYAQEQGAAHWTGIFAGDIRRMPPEVAQGAEEFCRGEYRASRGL